MKPLRKDLANKLLEQKLIESLKELNNSIYLEMNISKALKELIKFRQIASSKEWTTDYQALLFKLEKEISDCIKTVCSVTLNIGDEIENLFDSQGQLKKAQQAIRGSL